MLSRVSVVCFASSYAIALALELTRLLFRSGIRGILMVGFAAAGLFAHSVFLFYRAVNAGQLPLSSKQDWYLLAAWTLAALYLYLTVYHPKTPFGLFILPLVLALVGVATFFADSAPFPREPASQVWGMIHGTSILLATVALAVGFSAGLMYLGQARRLKLKRQAWRRLRLPSLEWLRRVNSRSLVVSLFMLGTGIASGMILNEINVAGDPRRLAWDDPIVLSTTIMFGWLLLSSAAGYVYRPAREGHRVAYLTVVSFVFLLIVLSSSLLFNTRHVGARPARTGSAGPRLRARAAGAAPLSPEHVVAADLVTPLQGLRFLSDRRSPGRCTGLVNSSLSGSEDRSGVGGFARCAGTAAGSAGPIASALPSSPARSPLPTARCPLRAAHCLLPAALAPPAGART
jgi:ABC-type transport system involved in cytochrome c biogenesis permease subunit